jgi:hypothetical protein
VRTVAAARLTELVSAIMRRAGCGEQEADTVARRLVDSNLVGHDSHGVLRVGKYLEWMREGWLLANQTPTIAFESEAIAIVDGNRGFGQVVGEFAGRLGIAKAGRIGIALVGLRNCGHLGRVGDWAELAAEAGQVSLHFLNTSGAQRVAPFGGSDRRLSTNPITIGVPIAGGDPIIVDMTTSMAAEGKLMVALNRGESVPEGWIIDKHGRPTTRPQDFYDGGALLTVGAHKGFLSSPICSPARFQRAGAPIPGTPCFATTCSRSTLHPRSTTPSTRFSERPRASSPGSRTLRRRAPARPCCFRARSRERLAPAASPGASRSTRRRGPTCSPPPLRSASRRPPRRRCSAERGTTSGEGAHHGAPNRSGKIRALAK